MTEYFYFPSPGGGVRGEGENTEQRDIFTLSRGGKFRGGEIAEV